MKLCLCLSLNENSRGTPIPEREGYTKVIEIIFEKQKFSARFSTFPLALNNETENMFLNILNNNETYYPVRLLPFISNTHTEKVEGRRFQNVRGT